MLTIKTIQDIKELRSHNLLPEALLDEIEQYFRRDKGTGSLSHKRKDAILALRC